MAKRRHAREWHERHRKFYETKVKPFITKPKFGNGCSFSPDGFILSTGYVSIVSCCEEHDGDYDEFGRTVVWILLSVLVPAEAPTRTRADAKLKRCIRCTLRQAGASLGYAGRRAALYFRVVRTFGESFYGSDNPDS